MCLYTIGMQRELDAILKRFCLYMANENMPRNQLIIVNIPIYFVINCELTNKKSLRKLFNEIP